MKVHKPFSLRQVFSREYIFLFVVTLFIRFPFFFRDYIDRDESTFILIGKSITDGYLPYDHMWDLKPPLLFYFFAFIQYLFPDSLIAIRFFGVVIVFISAIVLLQIARKLDLKNRFAIALSFVLLSSLFGSLQGIMSEHVAVFFFLPGLLFFFKKKTLVNLFISGFLFGCALLCKLNFAYTVASLLLYYLFFYHKETGLFATIKHATVVSFGVILPTVIIGLPYLLQDKLKLFIDSVFMATLEYGHKTTVTAIDKLMVSAWIIVLGLLISALALKFADKQQKKPVGLFIAMLAATIFTFYSSNTLNGHYLIQVYPFMAILILGYTLRKDLIPGYWKYAAVVLLLCVESYIEYYRIFKNYSDNGTFYNGKAFTSINELKKRGLENKKIFFADHHIGYWFLHQYPLTRSVTHPSSLSRPAFFKHFGNTRNTMEELKYIMEDINPEVIISRKPCLSFFSEDSEENKYFMSRIKTGFQLVYENPADRIFIWKKNESK